MGGEERAEDAARDAQDEDHELFRRNEDGIDRGLDAGGLALKSALFGLTRENNQPSRRAVTDSPPTWTKPILRYNAIAGSLPMVTYNASRDRKSTRLNSSHGYISYAVFCLKKKKKSIKR